ncbi:fumarylacetoacetate hydrolase family protein [Balneolales bacterium ANBcel1]|nr:fumarylacetoacetate hydrolase family protein [Balneolales bacterium ANBcel1]
MTSVIIPGLAPLPAGNIYCIGRNYAAHARELNNPLPTRPVIFGKPSASLTFDGIIRIPPFVADPHYEAELVVAIGERGKNIPAGCALPLIAGYAMGIDVTARDIQQELKEKSHPWLLAKGLDTFAPVGSFIASDQITDPQKLHFTLDINGKRRQNGDTSQMLFSVDELICTLSRYVTLQPGDLIFTGTPEGVGRLENGDRLHAELQAGNSGATARLDATVRFES